MTIKPTYSNMHDWEFYASAIETEYMQSIEEGLDIEKYKDLFEAVSKLPKDETKKKLGDVIFDIVTDSKTKDSYEFVEPSDLCGIKSLTRNYQISGEINSDTLESKIHGAWMGRVCGCLLGKTIEYMRTDELVPFLKESDNYPMHRYIYKTDINDEICEKYKYNLADRCFADEIDGMPVDDDTNYVVMAQLLIEKYGKDFKPSDVSKLWMDSQGKEFYCTAERVAYCNFMNGFEPPVSAVYKNPYREWIGAQIRGDYYGYINPGNPSLASDMAWRDASVSHTKNGIYGEMFISAMISTAAVSDNMEDIILSGLSKIPYTSRLYKYVMSVLNDFKTGVNQKECFDKIHSQFNEYCDHGWCHTIPNAMIVVAALLYGGGDFGKSVCMAVETGFDTDCNGATIGSVLGMKNGIDSIDKYWTKPINDTLHTSVFGVGTVKISDRVKITMKHILSD